MSARLRRLTRRRPPPIVPPMLLDIVVDPPTNPTYLLVAGSLLALTVLWLVWRKRRGPRAGG